MNMPQKIRSTTIAQYVAVAAFAGSIIYAVLTHLGWL